MNAAVVNKPKDVATINDAATVAQVDREDEKGPEAERMGCYCNNI